MNLNKFFQLNNSNTYVFWGVGDTFRKIYCFMENYIGIEGLIDDGTNESHFKGIKIYHADEFFSINISDKKRKFIITSQKYYAEIRKNLERRGYIFNEDFFYYRDWISWFFWSKNKEIWIDKIDLPITLKCIFKCKHCAMLAPYYKYPVDRPIEMLKDDINKFFSNVNMVREFMLVGGEPFLHSKLTEILDFIEKKGGGKILSLQIVTNGGVIPSESVLKSLKKYSVEVYISDYTNQINYSNKMNKFIKLLEIYGIYYKKVNAENWIDYGSVYDNNGLDERSLRNLFQKCSISCRTLYDKKIWYCSRSYSMNALGLCRNVESENDYINLTNVDIKEKILKFELGVLKNGYLQSCKNCNGSFYINKNIIPVAEQLR